MPKPPTVGDKVRSARVKKKLSQLELAHQAGVRPEVVSRIELGKSSGSLGSLYKIAPVLDMTLDDLLESPTIRVKKKKGTSS